MSDIKVNYDLNLVFQKSTPKELRSSIYDSFALALEPTIGKSTGIAERTSTVETCTTYLDSLIEQKQLVGYNVVPGEIYRVTRTRLTKHNQVQELRTELSTGALSWHPVDDWVLGLETWRQGPHKPRRKLRQAARCLVGRTHHPMNVWFTLVQPVNHIMLTIQAEPDVLTSKYKDIVFERDY